MSILLKPNGSKTKSEKAGAPEAKKIERTGENTFVVHADGGNKFEGTYNPKTTKLPGSNKLVFSNIGICLKECLVRNIHCDSCYSFSNLREKL